ncbi:MAG: hypothetical protein R2726_08615 [Acidimicrobiales bacterium]
MRNLPVVGRGGVPASGVAAVVLNVTVTGPTAPSHLTVFPAGESPPSASNLNFSAGQTVPNLVIAKVGAGGQVSLRNNSGSVQVIADVAGWSPDQVPDPRRHRPGWLRPSPGTGPSTCRGTP